MMQLKPTALIGTFNFLLTTLTKEQKGKPSSLAKAQICLEHAVIKEEPINHWQAAIKDIRAMAHLFPKES